MSEQGFAVRLTARIDGYLSAMDQAKKATKEVADGGVNFDRLGSKMQDVGMTLSKSVTLPLVAVGGVAVKMASDFEGAFGKMQGLAGVQADEVDGLKKAVLDLAGETAQAPQDLADGLYFLRSSGLSASDAMDALKVSARASAAGLGSTAVIADAVSSAMNAYAKSGLSAAEATDILTGTARAGKAEPAELASALGRVLPISSELGVSFKDVGGAIASLSLTGNDASTSATLLTNILSKLLKPSQQGAEALTGVGMSADSIRTSIADKGLLGTLEDLKTRLGDAGFVKFMEDAQAVQGALSLTGGNAEHVREVFDQVAASAGATDEAFAAMADTSGFKMKQAWADVQVALIQAGDVILPIVSGIADGIASLATTFSDLPGPVQAIIVAFLGLVAAAGPVLMVAGSLIKNFDLVKGAVSNMGSSAKSGFAAMGLAAAGVGVGLMVLQNHLDEVARTKAFETARIKLFADALLAGASAADALALAMNPETGSIEWIDAGSGETKNLITNLAAANITWDEFKSHLEGSKEAFNDWMISIGPAIGAGADLNALYQAGEQIIGEHTAAVQLAADTAAVMADSTNEQDLFLKRLNASTLEATDAQSGLAAAIPLTAEEEAALAAQEKENTEATKAMASALDHSTNRFEIAASAANLFRQALDAVFAPVQTLEDTEQALLVAIDAVTASFKKNGETLDINTDKGRANRDAIQAQANAALAHGVAMIGMGASTQEATNDINWNIAALENQMRAAGLSEEQIADYIATLGLTPANVDTAITLADTEATKVRIKGLQDQLGDIDAGAAAEIEALINQGKFAEAEAALNELARQRTIKLSIAKGVGWFGEIRVTSTDGLATAAGGTPPGGSLGGLTWVGEQGRELLDLPRGAVVHSNIVSERMVSATSMGYAPSGGSGSASPVVNNNTISFGDINNTMDMKAAWQQANFALASAA